MRRQNMRLADRIRLTGWAAPIVVFPYALIWKRCLFDGWSGWFYVLQRTLAETMIALEIVNQRLQRQRAPLDATSGATQAPLTDKPRER
jgi:hypothetical protein